jgi:hypothetical protein
VLDLDEFFLGRLLKEKAPINGTAKAKHLQVMEPMDKSFVRHTALPIDVGIVSGKLPDATGKTVAGTGFNKFEAVQAAAGQLAKAAFVHFKVHHVYPSHMKNFKFDSASASQGSIKGPTDMTWLVNLFLWVSKRAETPGVGATGGLPPTLQMTEEAIKKSMENYQSDPSDPLPTDQGFKLKDPQEVNSSTSTGSHFRNSSTTPEDVPRCADWELQVRSVKNRGEELLKSASYLARSLQNNPSFEVEIQCQKDCGGTTLRRKGVWCKALQIDLQSEAILVDDSNVSSSSSSSSTNNSQKLHLENFRVFTDFDWDKANFMDMAFDD